MKKHLLFLTLIVLFGVKSYGQSTKFNDLVYFTSLSNREVYDNLIQGSAFRQDFSTNINGQETEYFKNIVNRQNSEKIIVGKYTKLYDGTVLRTVSYTSTNPDNILSMISQARHYGLELKFRGADNYNNIYLFDNDLFHVSIYIKRDQKSGLVEIKQKEFYGLEN